MSATANHRHACILQMLQMEHELTLAKLVLETGASIATIRRDLLSLEQNGKVVRTLGGVRLADSQSLVERAFDRRSQQCRQEKLDIAAQAAKQVQDGMTIILDSGTTCWNLAKALQSRKSLRVVTSSIAIIEALGGRDGIEIYLVGGKFRLENLDFFGPHSIDTLGAFQADIAFLGCDSLLPKLGAFTHDSESAAISRAMCSSSRRHVLLCDHSKVGRSSPFLVMRPGEMDELITDQGVPSLKGEPYLISIGRQEA